jgi:hypothetical protein
MRIASGLALIACFGCSAGDKLGDTGGSGTSGNGNVGATGGASMMGSGGSSAGGSGGSSAGGSGGASGGAGGSSASGGSAAGGSSGGSGPMPGVGVSALTECKDPNIVGPTPVRRLSQLEYANAVRDLFNVSVSQGDLPTDELLGDVFVANTKTRMTEDQFIRYDTVAQTVADTAAANFATISGCGAADAACLKTYLSATARRAFHGVLEAADQTLLENLYSGVAVDDPTLAASTALHFILDSPRFLFTVEFGTPEATLSRLSPSEVAGRLASFLWRSVPDAALLAAADGGGLADEAGVREQATRLFQDPKAQPVLKAFVEQWLGLGSTGTDASAQAVDAEAGAVFGALAQGTGTYGDLFTSTMSRGSQDLATFYGVSLGGDGTMTLGPERAGLLLRGGFLRSHIKGDLGSPTQRGQVVRAAMICDPVSPPEENVDMTIPPAMNGETAKDLFNAHAADPKCAGCHALMDPIGYAFDQYGPDGKFDTALAPSTAGNIVAGTTNAFEADFADTQALMQLLATETVPEQCFTIQTARFALGRGESVADACGLSDIWTAFKDSSFSLQTLFVEVATSQLMQVRNIVKPGEACQ